MYNNVLYTLDRGIYEDTPKTEKSKRYVTLPNETMNELKKYKQYQAQEYFKNGIPQSINGFVFAQIDGSPMHPDSVTDYLNKFSKKYDLPHINAHAFRHPYVKLKLKILSAYFSRTFGAKVLDFPHDFNPVIGIYTHLFDKHIGKCLR